MDGRPIRHVVELRHASFKVPEAMALLRAHGVAVVFADSETFPQIPDVTAPFVYARLQQASEAEPAGYAAEVLDLWADRARSWSQGMVPKGLEPVDAAAPPRSKPGDVFVYMINGFKPKAPAAAMALIERLGSAGR